MSTHRPQIWRPLLGKGVMLVLAAGLILSAPLEGFSQSTDGGSEGTEQRPGDGGIQSNAIASQTATNGIIANIRAVVSECRRYEPIYRTDCLAQGLSLVAKRIPNGADYGQMRSLIARASGKLQAIARRDADPSVPRLQSKPGANPRFRAARRYSATKKAVLKKTLADASAVIDELQTELLRSSENSDKRAVHYQQVATAVGSTKVLLRS